MRTIDEIIAALREQSLLLEVTGAFGPGDVVRQITYDSRCAGDGTLFICKGAAFRPEYLQQAADRGSIAYMCERASGGRSTADADGQAESSGDDAGGKGKPSVELPNLPGLIVTDIRAAMAVVSAVFYGYHPGSPRLTGITGTKGKTTTAWYLKAILDEWQREKNGPETGLVSTIENYDGMHREEATMTTPEAPVLHEMLANTRASGIPYMTMEVSSQALKYQRVRGLKFQVGIFMNISEDHISPQEHVDFEDYFSSKLSIFAQTETACVNLDSDHRQRILNAAKKAKRIVTFGRHPKSDVQCTNICVNNAGICFRVKCDRFSEWFTLAMKGRFNIENALGAIAAAYVYGVPVECMKRALCQTRVPGRMETFYSCDGKICGIVDFAHNRLSFERLFDAVQQEYYMYSKVITIFGCPGGKALNRRRELGMLAGLFSSYVFITSDDPGTECLQEIAGEVREYVEMAGCDCSFVASRLQAVVQAVEMAEKCRERTLILVLGRGCEKFQKLGNAIYEYPMDAALLQEAFRRYEAKAAVKNPCISFAANL